MNRHFGMTTRATVGGNQSRGPLGSKYALPQNSILPHAARSPLKQINAAQALLDGLFVGGVVAFILSGAAAVVVGLFILLFVKI